MLEFYKINTNPKHRKTGDCSTRALCNILNISYEQALKEQCEVAMLLYYDITSNEIIDYIMKQHGWTKQKQPKTIFNSKYHIRNLDTIIDDEIMEEGILIRTKKHWTVVRDYAVEDTWDCRDYICGIYYIKELPENLNKN